MQQKKLSIVTFGLIIVIIAIIIIASYQTNFFSQASIKNVIQCSVTATPETTIRNGSVALNITDFVAFPANKGIDVCILKGSYGSDGLFYGYGTKCLTTFTTTENMQSYATNITIPNNIQLDRDNSKNQFYIQISNSREEGEPTRRTYKLVCYTPITVLVDETLPATSTTTETTTTSTSENTAPTTSDTSTTSPITTSTEITTPTTPTPAITSTTTTAFLPVPAQATTTTPAITAPIPTVTIPIITSTPATITSTPISSPTPTEPIITAIPIIVQDDNTGSTVETNKNEFSADGKDKVTISVTVKDNNGKTTTETVPTVEVTGNDNTVSEVKKEEDKFMVTLTTTNPEEKTIRVKAGNVEMPEIKIPATKSNIDLNKIAKNQPKLSASIYLTWWFWTLIILLSGLVLILALSMRARLHTPGDNL